MNKRDEKLWDICMDIYKELYKNAQPSADLDKLMASGETKKECWFHHYYLSEKDIKKIVKKHFKKNKLSKLEKRNIKFEIYLGASPTSSVKRFEETTGKSLKKAGLE